MPSSIASPPPALVASNPIRWLSVFGPGAIIASLTIGTGELIFSSRGGALFGYRILFLFAAISVCKWVLVYSSARHMVLTGVHPLERWMELPLGPRGWLPSVMFVFAALCIPIWVSFHSSVLGDLLAGLTQTKTWLNGGMIHVWGVLILSLVLTLAWLGGYAALERAQLFVVGVMLLLVSVAVVLLKPDWIELILGMVIPKSLAYPAWLMNSSEPSHVKIASRPIWVEASLYVGVIGGASYDYLAYSSFLRDKRWGLASSLGDRTERARSPSAEEWQQLRQWTRAPLIDCTLSFVIVVVFSAVFVASGWLVLAPQRQLPGDGNFLEHQAQFVTQIHSWLYPIYVAGTMLAMLGTLYGTLEIAPAIFRETMRLINVMPQARPSNIGRFEQANKQRTRQVALAWTGGGALLVLVISLIYQIRSGEGRPPGLTTLLIPANLFTGVLSCGIICLLNPWMDRVLPAEHRLPVSLRIMNWAAGCMFLILGLKGYWEFGAGTALAMLSAVVVLGCVVAYFAPTKTKQN